MVCSIWSALEFGAIQFYNKMWAEIAFAVFVWSDTNLTEIWANKSFITCYVNIYFLQSTPRERES